MKSSELSPLLRLRQPAVSHEPAARSSATDAVTRRTANGASGSALHHSPRLRAQRQQLEGAFGSAIPTGSDSADAVQRRVIMHNPADDEVRRSAVILAKDESQALAEWPLDGMLRSPEPETFVGHSGGANLDDVDAERLAQELLPKMDRFTFYELRIAACSTGKAEADGTSFASRLKSALARSERAVRVTAPKAPLFIAGPKSYMQAIGGTSPFIPEYRAIVTPGLKLLEAQRVGELIGAAKACVAGWMEANGDEGATAISALWNAQHAFMKGNKPNRLEGKRSRSVQAVLEALDACAETTANGRKKVDAMLNVVIAKCGGTPPDGQAAMQREIELFQRAYAAVVAAHPDDFKFDSAIGMNPERWAVEVHAPLLAAPKAD